MMNVSLSTINESLLSGFTLTLRQTRNRVSVLHPVAIIHREKDILLQYDAKDIGMKELTIVCEEKEGVWLLSLDADLGSGNGASRAFTSEDAVSFSMGSAVPDAILSFHHQCPWWTDPLHPASYQDIPAGSQNMLVRMGEVIYHLLPLCGENFRAEFASGVLTLTSDMAGLYRLRGPMLAIGAGETALATVEKTYRVAHDLGGISVPLRSGRREPAHFNNFGWCTWDSFYRNISSEKVLTKLAEFREKNIPVRWVILDDGWLSVENSRLAAFHEDFSKFPEGLKVLIARMKNEFGVEKVGVWHAFNGYWEGILPGSQLALEEADHLTLTPSGHLIPSVDEEKAFLFWDRWHSYLASCGIDFLKVDNQSSNSAYFEGICATAEGCRIAHRPIERSIEKNFGGACIDCMGMDMENVLARPLTAVSRNSDDFFPRRERGFIHHLTQNVYNAIWHNQLYVCDFDMWWSDHESAVQSGVLRAISGSPIYVSDEIGRSNAEKIAPLLDADGSLMRPEYAARPTEDCVFSGLSDERKLLTVWNRSGEAFGLAAFNTDDKEAAGEISFGAIPELDSAADYMAYEYFSQKWAKICSETVLPLTLPKDGCAVWSIYPIVRDEQGDYILAGDTAKYLPIAQKEKQKLYLSSL